uniref:Transcription initiation factor TFIID subunit 13 n=1 Tax=Chenopodium quinoa TaxID=63459 RepID=A0A803LF77_CHEQI
MSGGGAGGSFKQKVESSSKSDTSFKRKRGVFQKELQHMMYGYGDDQNPLPESVALVEDIVVEYVTDLAHKAQDVASKRGRLMIEDFLFIIRKVPGVQLLVNTCSWLFCSSRWPVSWVRLRLSPLATGLNQSKQDFPKLNRATELLAMNEELKQARKAFDMDEEKLVSGD